MSKATERKKKKVDQSKATLLTCRAHSLNMMMKEKRDRERERKGYSSTM